MKLTATGARERIVSPMIETVYSADADLRHPRRFVADAKTDAQHTARVAWELFRRNVQARYRRSWLGYAWLLLPTIATTMVWVYIQARGILTIPPTDIPYPVHVLTGMALWQTFVDALNAPVQQLRAGRQLVTRSRVPQEALILAGALEVLLNCLARLLVVAIVVVAYQGRIGSSILLAPVGIAMLIFLGLALGTVLAPLGLLYEDIVRGLPILTGLWFFLTPVIYPARGSGFLRFNPVTPLLETTRSWLAGSGGMADGFVLVSSVAAMLLMAGWIALRLARSHVVARLG
jgi:lipopolysaccharide transport system permease protein